MKKIMSLTSKNGCLLKRRKRPFGRLVPHQSKPAGDNGDSILSNHKENQAFFSFPLPTAKLHRPPISPPFPRQGKGVGGDKVEN